MSVTAARPAPFAFTELRLRALLAPLFARQSPLVRRYRDLRDLPNYLLLDIGVDPRHVPVRGEEVGRLDTFYGELKATSVRTAAKS